MTARGNDRRPIFLCDADRLLFLDLLEEAAERHDARVLAYCLMDNHIHLTLQDLIGHLSKMLKHLNGVYAQRFNLRHGRTGHLFEGRFWNSLLETDSYLATATEYVHRNPVEAGLCRSPDGYRWSSYRAYVGMARPGRFLDQALVLGLYGNDRALLRQQTERPRRDRAKEAELRKPWPKPVLGGRTFVDEHMRLVAAKPTAVPSSPATSVDLERVTSCVSAVFGVEPSSVLVVRRGARNDARLAAVSLATRRPNISHAEIADFFGLAAAHTVSTMSKRCADRATVDQRFHSSLERAAQRLELGRPAA